MACTIRDHAQKKLLRGVHNSIYAILYSWAVVVENEAGNLNQLTVPPQQELMQLECYVHN